MNNNYDSIYAPPVFVPMSEFGLNAKANDVYIDPQNVELSSLAGGFKNMSISDGQIEWLQRAQNANTVQTPDGVGAVPGVWMSLPEAIAMGIVAENTQFHSSQGVNLQHTNVAQENNVHVTPQSVGEKLKAKRSFIDPIQENTQTNKKKTSYNPSSYRIKSPLEEGLKPKF